MPLDDADVRDTPATRAHFNRSLTAVPDASVDYWTADWARTPDRDPFQVDFLRYWAIIGKHRFLVLGAMAAAVAVSIAVTLLTTPIYTATTTIQIEREAAKVVNLQDVMPTEQLGQSGEFYQTQYGLLKSRSLAERVVDRLGLANSATFLRAAGLKPSRSDISERGRRVFREAVLKSVMSNLTVTPVLESRLVKLSFNSRDPTIASLVANSFAENYVSTNLERRFESSSYAREFLERQLALAKAKLEESERQAAAYAAKQQLINLHQGDPNSDKGSSTTTESLAEAKLAALNAVYAQATAARIDAEQKWRQAQLTPSAELPQVLASPTVQTLSQERARLQGEYENNGRLFQPAYPAQQQLKAQIDEIGARIVAESETIKQSLFAQYNTALRQEKSLASQINQLKTGVLDFNNLSIQYNVLQREADTNRTLYDALLQRYKDVGVTGAIAANNVSIIDRAQPPLNPSKPIPALNLVIGLLFGLGLGIAAAFAAVALDQALRAPGDVEAKLGLALLGATPLLTRGVTPAEAMKDPRSPLWEAYYSVRTALQFATTAGAPKSLLVVSARPGEGKSTTAVAIATSFARLGARTLLVDADLRNPSVHSLLGRNPAQGFSNYLTGSMGLAELVQTVEETGLMVITSGPLPPTPAELLADMRVRTFISEAESMYDIVIFDGPPVMGFADAVMISAAVSATMLIVEAGKTGRGQANSAIRRLRMAQARIVGAVLTKYDYRKVTYGYGDESGYGYGYSYQYSYGNVANQRPSFTRLSKKP